MQTTPAARAIAFRTRAAFLVLGSWQWVTWTHAEPNKHAAIIDKGGELKATAWDFGNADHDELSRWNTATLG